jgi:hypothetical protein
MNDAETPDRLRRMAVITAAILSKSAFAARRNVDASTVSKWIARRKIYGAALTTDGRIDVVEAERQLEVTLDAKQSAAASARPARDNAVAPAKAAPKAKPARRPKAPPKLAPTAVAKPGPLAEIDDEQIARYLATHGATIVFSPEQIAMFLREKGMDATVRELARKLKRGESMTKKMREPRLIEATLDGKRVPLLKLYAAANKLREAAGLKPVALPASDGRVVSGEV